MANNSNTKPSAARPQEDGGSEQILSRYASVLLDSTFKRTFGTDKGFIFRFSLHEDSSNEKMTDRLNFIFLELPNARHYDTEGTSITEKICYTLAHMDTFEHRPPKLKEKFFEILFRLLEIANFAPDERVKYQHEMTTERDRINQLDYARKKGREEERTKNAKNLLALGVDPATIAKATGLSEAEMARLK